MSTLHPIFSWVETGFFRFVILRATEGSILRFAFKVANPFGSPDSSLT